MIATMKRSRGPIEELKKSSPKECGETLSHAEAEEVNKHVSLSKQRALEKPMDVSEDQLAERMSAAVTTILPKVIRRIIERDSN